MDTNELTEWGAAENAARLNDIRAVHAGEMTLKDAQAAARRRRLAVGLTAGQASTAVRLYGKRKT